MENSERLNLLRKQTEKDRKTSNQQPKTKRSRSISAQNSTRNSMKSWAPDPGEDSLRQQQTKDLKHPNDPAKILYISCLSPKMTLLELFDFFRKYGKIVKINAWTPFKEKSANRFSAITFDSFEGVSELSKLESVEIGKKTLKMSPVHSIDSIFDQIEHLRMTRVYVDNLPTGMKSKDLGELFSKYGEIEKVFLVKKKKRLKDSRRNGTIIFVEEDTVTKLPEQGVEYQGQRLVWKSYYFNFGAKPGNRRHYVMRKDQYSLETFTPSKESDMGGRDFGPSIKPDSEAHSGREEDKDKKIDLKRTKNKNNYFEEFGDNEGPKTKVDGNLLQEAREQQQRATFDKFKHASTTSYNYYLPKRKKFKNDQKKVKNSKNLQNQQTRKKEQQQKHRSTGDRGYIDYTPAHPRESSLRIYSHKRPPPCYGEQNSYLRSEIDQAHTNRDNQGDTQDFNQKSSAPIRYGSSYAPRGHPYRRYNQYPIYSKAYQERISEEDSIEYSYSSKEDSIDSDSEFIFASVFENKAENTPKIINNLPKKRRKREEATHLLRMIGHLRHSDEPWKKEEYRIATLGVNYNPWVARGILPGIISQHLISRPTRADYHNEVCFYNHHPRRNLYFRVDQQSCYGEEYQS